MRVVDHRAKIRKPFQIHDRLSVFVVIVHSWGGVRGAACLPIVVEAHVTVTEVTERSRLTVQCHVFGFNAVHDGHDELLVDICAIEVPVLVKLCMCNREEEILQNAHDK